MPMISQNTRHTEAGYGKYLDKHKDYSDNEYYKVPVLGHPFKIKRGEVEQCRESRPLPAEIPSPGDCSSKYIPPMISIISSPETTGLIRNIMILSTGCQLQFPDCVFLYPCLL